MLLFYVRHGDPVYDPDSLTPLGERQAQAVAKRLALYGVDTIYASTSNRAIQTAQPTCELLRKKAELLDFANESHTWRELSYNHPNGKNKLWLFQSRKMSELFNSKEIRDLGDEWYNHPAFAEYDYQKGIERVYNEGDAFLESLGYQHIRGTGKYKVIQSNNSRVALFAHQGFGLAFLSCLLDIPYPMFCTHFDMTHTGVTVINFEEGPEFAIPKVLTLSSDAHIYREGLPLTYNNGIRF